MPNYICTVCRRANRRPLSVPTTCYYCSSVYDLDPFGELRLIQEKKPEAEVVRPAVKKTVVANTTVPAPKVPANTPDFKSNSFSDQPKPEAGEKKKRKRVVRPFLLAGLVALMTAMLFFIPGLYAALTLLVKAGLSDALASLQTIFYQDVQKGQPSGLLVLCSLLLLLFGVCCIGLLPLMFYANFLGRQQRSVRLKVAWANVLVAFGVAYVAYVISYIVTKNIMLALFWAPFYLVLFFSYSNIAAKNRFITEVQVCFSVAGLFAGLIYATHIPFSTAGYGKTDHIMYTYMSYLGGFVAGNVAGLYAGFGLIRVFGLFETAEQEAAARKQQERQRQIWEQQEKDRRAAVLRQENERQQQAAAEQKRKEAAAKAEYRQLLAVFEADRLASAKREAQQRQERLAREEQLRLSRQRVLVFDTETADLPRDYQAPPYQTHQWPRLVQLAWREYDGHGQLMQKASHIVKPEGFSITPGAFHTHQISTAHALQSGALLQDVMTEFQQKINRAGIIVCHHAEFDINVVEAEFIRLQLTYDIHRKIKVCTMKETATFCALPKSGGGYKYPKLSELHQKLFNRSFEGAHRAEKDTEITADCFWELRKRKLLKSVEATVVY